MAHELGPLRWLVGEWEGQTGDDIAPGDDRGSENNKFRERMSFEPTGLVENHEQRLYGLRYRTTAWRLGVQDPFHEELGYWLWDAKAGQVMRCFLVPRGVSVLAGGAASQDARQLRMEANLGSPIYGICSNPFLDQEFKTVRYVLELMVHDEGSFSYDEDTQLLMRGKSEIFHHRDRNSLKRVR